MTAGRAGLALTIAAAALLGAPDLRAAGDAPAAPDAGEALRLELRGVRHTQGAADAARRKLEEEVAALKGDRARLKDALIDTTQKIDAAAARADDGQKRLDTLTGSEQAIRRSLEGRRAVLGEILAALQRMGRAAPPALLVRPDDLLAAVHASILLGSVLPEMRSEAQALAEDLRDLVSLRASIAAEREGLARDLAALEAERARLTALTDARQQAQGDAERALETERQRAADLAGRAQTLEALISRAEADSAAARQASDLARAAEETRQRQAALESSEQQARIAASPFKDTARLAPAIPFVDAKGKLPMPVSGSIVRPFGAPDGFGGAEKGLSIGARAEAPVVSPSDGWVVFAAPYRSYGQLIVINAGGGYHVVLAGLEKTSVAAGQFVLAGEPVGTMGAGAAKTAAAIAIGATQPVLYVEFRKDGSAIDPGPWWAPQDTQRVRG